MKINLHIERLVLDGINISPGQRDLLQASVTIELAQLLNNGDLAGNIVEGVLLPRLSADSIKLTGNNPTQLGQQIAQSIYGGISRE